MTRGLFGGRWNRANYWTLWAVVVALSIGLEYFTGKHTQFGLVFFIAMCVGRLHDIGRSGWWVVPMNLPCLAVAIAGFALDMPALIALSALLGVAPMIWLGCVPGQPGANKFGEPPPPGLAWRARKKPAPEDVAREFS